MDRTTGLRGYAKRRNQIEVDGVSRMSAYLHYGMVSPFRIAREASADGAEKYLDELLIWRELAYAFCYFRNDLDSEANLPSPRIETIGSGLAGLMCARILSDQGLNVKCFEKSHRVSGRASTRNVEGVCQFDHGAQYFTIRDPFLKPYVESWCQDHHVAEWKGHIVSIDEFGKFRDVAMVQRFVGTPRLESLGIHLSRDLSVALESEVASVVQVSDAYRLISKDDRVLGDFDVVLWNCPPAQVAKQLPLNCSWREELFKVEMVPCWAVMLATEHRWQVPFDGAFVNQGKLGWIARDSSKPSRSKHVETYVLHSTVAWAKENLGLSKEQAIESLVKEAEKVTGVAMPNCCLAQSHHWLYSRPTESLIESSLWDDDNQLGACGDWCGGPRIEGALQSGMSLAGRVLSWLHERTIATSATLVNSSEVIQLELF